MGAMKSLIVGNWKMNPATADEAGTIAKATRGAVDSSRLVTVVACPPSVYVRELVKKYGGIRPNGKRLSFGVQNLFYEKSGSFTGEMSVDMARDAGIEYAIVGHSERRRAGETNSDVQKKATAIIRGGMYAIVCVGESTRDEHGNYLKDLERQIRESVPLMPRRYFERLIVAYEPVWAIGAQAVRSATPQEVMETTLFVRKILASLFSKDLAFKVPILYGGSVDSTNAIPVLKESGVQGLLIGRESLQEKTYPALIKAIADAK